MIADQAASNHLPAERYRNAKKEDNDDQDVDDDDDVDDHSIIKSKGDFPVDMSGGCHTIFLYCDLVQNEILGDTQTALLRAIPLDDDYYKHRREEGTPTKQQNYKTFSKLQWRRIVKSTVESITVSLRNESGQLVPFLSRGRTNLTLNFRQCALDGPTSINKNYIQ